MWTVVDLTLALDGTRKLGDLPILRVRIDMAGGVQWVRLAGLVQERNFFVGVGF
jgi:hypothetical protein